MAELQRAVAMAERRAIESVAGERIKMERIIRESATAAAAMAATANSTKNGKIEAATGLKNQDLFGQGGGVHGGGSGSAAAANQV